MIFLVTSHRRGESCIKLLKSIEVKNGYTTPKKLVYFLSLEEQASSNMVLICEWASLDIIDRYLDVECSNASGNVLQIGQM